MRSRIERALGATELLHDREAPFSSLSCTGEPSSMYSGSSIYSSSVRILISNLGESFNHDLSRCWDRERDLPYSISISSTCLGTFTHHAIMEGHEEVLQPRGRILSLVTWENELRNEQEMPSPQDHLSGNYVPTGADQRASGLQYATAA